MLRVARGGVAILIGGDAPLGSWERLEGHSRAARVIRVPHHGGEIREHGERWTRFGDLYGAVEAQIACVSVGTNNGNEHPLPDHVTAARRAGASRLLCTQITPRCHADPARLRKAALEHAGIVEWPYRHLAFPDQPHRRPSTEVPCAGSMVAWITRENNLELEPRPGGLHERFLRRVEAPMCVARNAAPKG